MSKFLHKRPDLLQDVKANNIMIDWDDTNGEIAVERIELADLEGSAYVPPGSVIEGGQVGNQLWRSPEAHAKGPVNTYSDMFSFGIVVRYHPLMLYCTPAEGKHILVHIRNTKPPHLCV